MAGIVLRESAYGTPTTLVAFSHRIVFAGTKQCSANVLTTITLPGVLDTDIVLITNTTLNTNPFYVRTAIPSAGSIAVTFSGAMNGNDYFYYVVLRAC